MNNTASSRRIREASSAGQRGGSVAGGFVSFCSESAKVYSVFEEIQLVGLNTQNHSYHLSLSWIIQSRRG
ncbi:hypothetical protein N9Y42_03645 [Mariniblastus sp.]|nr:hypothetical protein [Mariniblastus sp.]